MGEWKEAEAETTSVGKTTVKPDAKLSLDDCKEQWSITYVRSQAIAISKQPIVIGSLIVASCLLAGICLGILLFRSPQNNFDEVAPASPEMTVTGWELFEAYADVASADSKYRGKQLRVWGNVDHREKKGADFLVGMVVADLRMPSNSPGFHPAGSGYDRLSEGLASAVWSPPGILAMIPSHRVTNPEGVLGMIYVIGRCRGRETSANAGGKGYRVVLDNCRIDPDKSPPTRR